MSRPLIREQRCPLCDASVRTAFVTPLARHGVWSDGRPVGSLSAVSGSVATCLACGFVGPRESFRAPLSPEQRRQASRWLQPPIDPADGIDALIRAAHLVPFWNGTRWLQGQLFLEAAWRAEDYLDFYRSRACREAARHAFLADATRGDSRSAAARYLGAENARRLGDCATAARELADLQTSPAIPGDSRLGVVIARAREHAEHGNAEPFRVSPFGR